MEVRIAVAKINKYASSESGDTVEVIERPKGGVSVVMADGQSSGKGAKSISNLVVRKVIALLAEGVRDGAAARAASDSLFTDRHGKVSATLNIISIDRLTKTLVLTCNNPLPVVVLNSGQIELVQMEAQPIGLYFDTRPEIIQFPLKPNFAVIAFTDGLVHAGSRQGCKLSLEDEIQRLASQSCEAQFLADGLLEAALRLDEGRPVDDISVVVVGVQPHEGDEARRMSVRLPITL